MSAKFVTILTLAILAIATMSCKGPEGPTGPQGSSGLRNTSELEDSINNAHPVRSVDIYVFGSTSAYSRIDSPSTVEARNGFLIVQVIEGLTFYYNLSDVIQFYIIFDSQVNSYNISLFY